MCTVIPLAFALNLLGTLSSSGVILFANSLTATPAVMHKLFGNKVQEHSIMRYPAIFLVGGVASLFAGFLCGIILYYGLGVAALCVSTHRNLSPSRADSLRLLSQQHHAICRRRLLVL